MKDSPPVYRLKVRPFVTSRGSPETVEWESDRPRSSSQIYSDSLELSHRHCKTTSSCPAQLGTISQSIHSPLNTSSPDLFPQFPRGAPKVSTLDCSEIGRDYPSSILILYVMLWQFWLLMQRIHLRAIVVQNNSVAMKTFNLWFQLQNVLARCVLADSQFVPESNWCLTGRLQRETAAPSCHRGVKLIDNSSTGRIPATPSQSGLTQVHTTGLLRGKFLDETLFLRTIESAAQMEEEDNIEVTPNILLKILQSCEAVQFVPDLCNDWRTEKRSTNPRRQRARCYLNIVLCWSMNDNMGKIERRRWTLG